MTSNGNDSGTNAFKGAMMALIFSFGLIGGFFPAMFANHQKGLSLLNCFAGGVILSAGLMVRF